MNEFQNNQLATAHRLVRQRDLAGARDLLTALQTGGGNPETLALVANDLGTIEALQGNRDVAKRHFLAALDLDGACEAAIDNLHHLQATDAPACNAGQRRQKVAILSLLFNWPSTGGGTVHTTETAKFLSAAGYEVRHFSAEYAAWGIGQIHEPPPYPVTTLRFDADDWNAASIQRRFRDAVDGFAPDWVIITDSWNFKPLLAEAVRGYRYLLRLAAQECLCPLNNLRLLIDETGRATTCPRHQLATPDACRDCVATRERQSGDLHRLERRLAGFDSEDYVSSLRRAFAGAEAVLAVNPLIAAAIAPYCQRVEVIPSGFDPRRFPETVRDSDREQRTQSSQRIKIVFAGLPHEFIKGFHILRRACDRLWEKRQDFELVVTADVPTDPEPYARYIGWQSQADLPQVLREAEVVVVPTVAEDALGRTAVEAMGAGRAVLASRIGGLPFTVLDEATGLLFEAGNAQDLTAKLERLLDDPGLRRRMGEAGRRRFETEYAWPVVIERDYRQLLGPALLPVEIKDKRCDLTRESVRNAVQSVVEKSAIPQTALANVS